jgi:aminoglycoside/choline kinase family phosphotransferase
VDRFTNSKSRQLQKMTAIAEAVSSAEHQLVQDIGEDGMIQGHGDFHPKNVIIGQDNQDNRDTVYVAAIDFEGSLVMPAAFDVGCFLAQFRNQFFAHPAVLAAYPEELFLAAYLQESESGGENFFRQVELFRARANLSIASYFVKVGMGETEDLWRVLVEAEQALTLL